jgi:hypothetical protein
MAGARAHRLAQLGGHSHRATPGGQPPYIVLVNQDGLEVPSWMASDGTLRLLALFTSGWENRAAAVVLDPELEIWVWSDSPEVEAVQRQEHDQLVPDLLLRHALGNHENVVHCQPTRRRPPRTG